MTRRVAVVGGGITGLAAAYELGRNDPDAQVTLFEASKRLGGIVRTSPFDGTVIDESADAFLVRVPWALELCDELGLEPELTSPAARNAFVWSRGALRPLPTEQLLGIPTDLDALAATGIVSPEGVDRARQDLDRTDPPLQGDPSIGSFVRDRLGDEVLERLVEPLIGGINAGRTDHLSLRAVAAQVAAAADLGGSLVRAAAELRSGATVDPSAPVFKAPAGGMQRLVDRLAEALTAEICLATPAHRLTGEPDAWELDARPGTTFDRVIVTTPAPHAAQLVARSARAAGILATTDYASVVLVVLAYRRDQIAHPLDGSGYLVPVPETEFVTACSFASSKWDHVGDDDTVILRVSAGRDGDAVPVSVLADGEILDRVRADLDRHLGIDVPPAEHRVSRWPGALAQYRPGHLDRMDEMDAALADDLPGVTVTGAACRGIGIPACIHQGREAARAVLASA